MSANYIEELVSEYFRIRGYFVMSNYWFPSKTETKRTVKGRRQKYEAQSWSDIDVVAINPRELVLVEAKAGINRKEVANGIIVFFKKLDCFLKDGIAPDRKSHISWWREKREIKKLVVYEFCGSNKYLGMLRKNGIECRDFKDLIDDIVAYVKEKKGVKEEIPTMRLLHFLHEKKMYR